MRIKIGRSRRSILSFVAVLAMGAMVCQQARAAPESSRFNSGYFTNLSVITHNGKQVNFYDDLIKGKRVVINFAYLNCKDICPLAVSRLAEVTRQLGDAVGRDVFFYTITMDPANDTPELLKMYADGYGAGPGWLFLTGKPADVERIRFQLGERSRKLIEHRNDIVLGNDIDGEWSHSSAFADIEVIVETIRELDPAYRAQTRKPHTGYAEAEARQITAQPGQALFLKACSTCHTIGRGTLVGPDLKHVAARRNREWLTQFLMSPERMRARNDPAALELAAKFRGVRMPNLGLLENDVADVLQYIDAQSAKHDAAAAAAGNPPPLAKAGPSG